MNDEQITTIRSLYAQGVKQRDLAQQFHVNQSAISKIVNGVHYGYVDTVERYCLYCNAPIASGKRCTDCRALGQNEYYKQWYKRKKQIAQTRRYHRHGLYTANIPGEEKKQA